MKKICVLTATRAEYGLLKPIIKKLIINDDFDVRIVATGAHLSPEFGLTYQEIERDGFKIDKKIEMLLSSDTPMSISKSMGLAMIGFADYFNDLNPDLLIVLGDRYETLAVAIAAMNSRIPIAHLYGGEITEGAVDDCIRHAITKLSYIHFTSTEDYKKRVIQLGEHPERVFNVGAVGIENIMNEKLFSKEELGLSLEMDLSKPFAVVTFHPVTLENNSSENQIISLLEACRTFEHINFVFTKANADTDGRIINKYIDEYTKTTSHFKSFTSLGVVRYLSALKYCSLVIGNSSSGLVEAPSFGMPIINIGERQKGRLQATSVINCEPNEESIINSIKYALSSSYKESHKSVVNPYGDGQTSEKVVETLSTFLLSESIDLKKKFYDVEVKS